MAISTTYLLLCSQIADELGGRTDLLSTLSGSGLTLSPIKNAVQSAIAKWERFPFYFNETYDASFLTTVNNQEFYTSSDKADIATLSNVHSMWVTQSSTRYPLVRQTEAQIEDRALSSAGAGVPTHFSYLAERIRFYPIPNAALVVGAVYTKKLTALSADADTNVWTQDGFDLIRAEAKLILANEVIFDAELATRMVVAIYGDATHTPPIKGYLTVLLEETERRGRYEALRAAGMDATGGASAARGRSQ